MIKKSEIRWLQDAVSTFACKALGGLGYEPVVSSEVFVLLENDKNKLVFTYDYHRSYGIYVTVLLNGVLYSLSELSVAFSDGDPEGNIFYQSADIDSAFNCFQSIVSRLQDLLPHLDRLDAQDILRDTREKMLTQYAEEVLGRLTRGDIQSAWENREFGRMVKLYEKIEHQLTRAERLKYNYVKRKERESSGEID